LNRLYETGLMLLVFTIAINSAIVAFGEPMMAAKLPMLDSNHSYPVEKIPMLDSNFSQYDVNLTVSSGSSFVKSGDPVTEIFSGIGKGITGTSDILGKAAWFASAYYTVLKGVLPAELSFIASMIFTILTAIQIFTITHFVLVFLSIIRGGGM